MHIYIHPLINGALRNSIQQAIAHAGHQTIENPGLASYGIRLFGQKKSNLLDSRQDVIINDFSRVDTVPEDATLVDVGALKVWDTNRRLSDWLAGAPDPLDSVS